MDQENTRLEEADAKLNTKFDRSNEKTGDILEEDPSLEIIHWSEQVPADFYSWVLNQNCESKIAK